MMLFFVLGCAKDGEMGPPGEKGPQGEQGVNGSNGSKILSGSTAPGATLGSLGDFYLNLSLGDLYGPKNNGSNGGWGKPFSLKGPSGEQGIPGVPGATILSGQRAPSISLGKLGDFYINIKEMTLYGPKTATSWGDPVSLKSDKDNGVSVYVIKPDWNKGLVTNTDGSNSTFTNSTSDYSIEGNVNDTYFVIYAAASPSYYGLSSNINLNRWEQLERDEIGADATVSHVFSHFSIGIGNIFSDVRIQSQIISPIKSNITKFKFDISGTVNIPDVGAPFFDNTLWLLVKSYKYQELKAKDNVVNAERYLRLR